MSHPFTSGGQVNPSFLNRKRIEAPMLTQDNYHHERFEHFDKYSNGQYRFNSNNLHHKSSNDQYYRQRYRYNGRNCYNNPQQFFKDQNSNRREYNKKYPKFQNNDSEVRNLSHCDIPNTPLDELSEKEKDEKKNKGPQKLPKNGGQRQTGNYQNFFHSQQQTKSFAGNKNFQQNISIQINLTNPSDLKFNEKSLKEDEQSSKKDEMQILQDKNEDDKLSPCSLKNSEFFEKFKKKNDKIFESFEKLDVKIEANPFDNFEAFSNVYMLDKSSMNLENDAKDAGKGKDLKQFSNLDSCYLLAKIQDWNLVTNFVSASSLNEEKFDKILSNPLSKKPEDSKEFHVVYDEKYETTISKLLEQNKILKDKLFNEIQNSKNAIGHLSKERKIAECKINQNEFDINLIGIKNEVLLNGLKEINES